MGSGSRLQREEKGPWRLGGRERQGKGAPGRQERGKVWVCPLERPAFFFFNF